MQRLRDKGISIPLGRVVDLTLVGIKYGVAKAALDAFLEASEFDLVLATIGLSRRYQVKAAVEPIIQGLGYKTT